MRRLSQSILVVVALAAGFSSGCKLFDRERADRGRSRDDTAATPASRTRSNPGGKNWQDGPTPGFDRGGVPAADSWADPNDPSFDVDREVRGILAGFVEDPDGRKVRDVYISVEAIDTGKSGGAKVGVQTDPQGYFMIKGLKPRTTYVLTTDAIKIDGREMAGRLYARTTSERSQYLRITMIEGLTFPGSTPSRDRPGSSDALGQPTRPTETSIAPSVFPDNAMPSNVPSAASSGGARSDTPLRNRDPGTGLPMPAPSTAFPPTAPASPVIPRNDLSVEGPQGIWRPPAATIPSNRSESKAIKPNRTITLLDTLGVPRDLPSGRRGEFILLDFMTTNCFYCKKAIPALKDIQARYGLSGLELVGVLCDDTKNAQRRALASAYQRSNQLNYLIYVEQGERAGQVMREFDIASFPSLVLLNSNGDVIWQGHPAKMDQLEAILKDEIARAKQ